MLFVALCHLPPSYNPESLVVSSVSYPRRAVNPRASLQEPTRAEMLRWSTAALSVMAFPAFARESTPNEQREALQAIIEQRGGLDPGKLEQTALFPWMRMII